MLLDQSQCRQDIAEDEAGGRARVVERDHAEVVSRTKQAPGGGVPEGEGEVPDQVLDAGLAPDFVCEC